MLRCAAPCAALRCPLLRRLAALLCPIYPPAQHWLAPALPTAPPATPQLKRNSRALDKWRQQHVPPGLPPALPPGAPLSANRIYKHLQASPMGLRVGLAATCACSALCNEEPHCRMRAEPPAPACVPLVPHHTAPCNLARACKQAVLRDTHALVCDIGDCLFFASKLKLPGSCSFEVQVRRRRRSEASCVLARHADPWLSHAAPAHGCAPSPTPENPRERSHGTPCPLPQSCYGSIGWSLGATLGYGIGAPGRRVICIIGDGAAQMTIQVRTAPALWLTCSMLSRRSAPMQAEAARQNES